MTVKEFIWFIIVCAFGSLALLAFIGGGAEPKRYVSKEELRVLGHVSVLLDPETGCQYIAPRWGGGISPRYDATGKHICEAPK